MAASSENVDADTEQGEENFGLPPLGQQAGRNSEDDQKNPEGSDEEESQVLTLTEEQKNATERKSAGKKKDAFPLEVPDVSAQSQALLPANWNTEPPQWFKDLEDLKKPDTYAETQFAQMQQSDTNNNEHLFWIVTRFDYPNTGYFAANLLAAMDFCTNTYDPNDPAYRGYGFNATVRARMRTLGVSFFDPDGNVIITSGRFRSFPFTVLEQSRQRKFREDLRTVVKNEKGSLGAPQGPVKQQLPPKKAQKKKGPSQNFANTQSLVDSEDAQLPAFGAQRKAIRQKRKQREAKKNRQDLLDRLKKMHDEIEVDEVEDKQLSLKQQLSEFEQKLKETTSREEKQQLLKELTAFQIKHNLLEEPEEVEIPEPRSAIPKKKVPIKTLFDQREIEDKTDFDTAKMDKTFFKALQPYGFKQQQYNVPDNIDIGTLLKLKASGVSISQRESHPHRKRLVEQVLKEKKPTCPVFQPTENRHIDPKGNQIPHELPLTQLLDPYDHLKDVRIKDIPSAAPIKCSTSTSMTAMPSDVYELMSSLDRLKQTVHIHLKNTQAFLPYLRGDVAQPSQDMREYMEIEAIILGSCNFMLSEELNFLQKTIETINQKSLNASFNLHKKGTFRRNEFPRKERPLEERMDGPAFKPESKRAWAQKQVEELAKSLKTLTDKSKQDTHIAFPHRLVGSQRRPESQRSIRKNGRGRGGRNNHNQSYTSHKHHRNQSYNAQNYNSNNNHRHNNRGSQHNNDRPSHQKYSSTDPAPDFSNKNNRKRGRYNDRGNNRRGKRGRR